jgi:integrase
MDAADRDSERNGTTTATTQAREEVERLINSAANLLHRVWLLILYATGMRRDELVHLKVSDIDSARWFTQGGSVVPDAVVFTNFVTMR